MSRSPNIFTNPATGATYSWEINHLTEDESGKKTNITDSAPTGGLGLMPQQGASEPITFTYHGTILTKAQLDQMIAWRQLCESQTIYFQDFSGDKYEVTITQFSYQRVAVAQNPRDMTHAPTWKWQYTIAMRVLRVISGSWVGTTP